MIETLKNIYKDIYQNQEKVAVELKKAFDTDDINYLTNRICSICEAYEYIEKLMISINDTNCQYYYFDYTVEETTKIKTIIRDNTDLINNLIECLNYEYNELDVYKIDKTLSIIKDEVDNFIDELEDITLCIDNIEMISSKFREELAIFYIRSFNNKMLNTILANDSIDVQLSLLYASNIEHEAECNIERMNNNHKTLVITQNEETICSIKVSNEFSIHDEFINEFNEVMNDY